MFSSFLKLFLSLFLFCFFTISISAFGHGFNANWVDIFRLNNGKYRVVIKYTNLAIGQYAEAYVDYTDKKKAIEVFRQLALGADFFLGKDLSIHFHDEPEKPTPY